MLKMSKSIDEIYEEVKDYDMVISSDAALATGLNKRLDKAFVGTFAYTPLQLASEHAFKYFHSHLRSKESAAMEIARKMDLPLRYVYSTIDRINDISSHGANPSLYLNNLENKIYEHYDTIPTSYKALELFDTALLNNKRIAVVGIELFSESDYRILPETYDVIDVSSHDVESLENVYLVDSESSALSLLNKYVNEENSKDVAIVIDTRDALLAPMKSSFYSRGIAVVEKDFIKENVEARSYLELLRLIMHPQDITIRQARPFMERSGISIDFHFDDYKLSRFIGTAQGVQAKEWYESLFHQKSMTFEDAIAYCDDEYRDVVSRILEALDIASERINEKMIDDLQFFIINNKIETDSQDKGVVIIDCNRSAFIDRPLVFYIGLDASWTPIIPQAEYIDANKEMKKHTHSFQIMLSQGQARMYIVPYVRNSQKQIPCYLFNYLYGKAISGFEDEIFSAKWIKSSPQECAHISKPSIESEPSDFGCFSQSSLNAFYKCPKQYEFKRIVTSPERSYFYKGTLLHAFAECYVSNKEKVKELGLDSIADSLVEMYLSINGSLHRDLEKTSFLVGMKNIVSFLDGVHLHSTPSLTRIQCTQRKDNELSPLIGSLNESPHTELYFEDHSLHLKGFIDLVIDDTWIVDYKSSKMAPTSSNVLKRSLRQLIYDEVDFQPLVYLSYLRSMTPESTLKFSYFYFLCDKQLSILGNAQQEGRILEVYYHPVTFNEFLTTPQAHELLASSKERNKFLEMVGKQDISVFFLKYPMDADCQFHRAVTNTEYYKSFEKYILSLNNTVKPTMIQSYMKAIVELRKRGSKIDNTVHYFKEDLEQFENFVKEQHGLMLLYRKTGFPKNPLSKKICDKCEYRDICCEGW